jgi:hypothetical protein
MSISIELVFECGHGKLPPSAYLGVTGGSCPLDTEGRTMLTMPETSSGAFKAQVDEIKARLDSCLAEAQACFAA